MSWHEELDVVSLYLRDVGNHELLTAEDEQRLATTFQAGREARQRLADETTFSPAEREELACQVEESQQAFEQMFLHNQRLVVHIAARYQDQGVPLPDLIQEGCLGLMRAIDKFEPERGHRFSTYASWWIEQKVRRALHAMRYSIRLPEHIHQIRRKARQASRILQQLDPDAAITTERIAAYAKLPVAQVEWAMAAEPQTLDLDRPVGVDITMGDFVVDTTTPPMDEILDDLLQKQVIDAALAELPPRQAYIITRCFELDGEPYESMTAVGNELNLSRERVRQLRQKALKQLRASDHLTPLHAQLTGS